MAGIIYSASTITKDVTFSANASTYSTTLWTVTGRILVLDLFGVVTTAIGSNHTGGLFRAESGAGVSSIHASSVTLSSLGVGVTVAKIEVASVALALLLKTAGTFNQRNPESVSPFEVAPIGGETTVNIVYRHATTNNPESGAMRFTLNYVFPDSTSTIA